MALTALGVLIGLIVAFATMRLMSSLLFQVSPVDPWTYILTTTCIVAVACLASYVPSRRAISVDIVEGLRAE